MIFCIFNNNFSIIRHRTLRRRHIHCRRRNNYPDTHCRLHLRKHCSHPVPNNHLCRCLNKCYCHTARRNLPCRCQHIHRRNMNRRSMYLRSMCSCHRNTGSCPTSRQAQLLAVLSSVLPFRQACSVTPLSYYRKKHRAFLQLYLCYSGQAFR